MEAEARRLGLDVVRDETSVRVSVGDEASGATLALASHLDVVPPGDGWTRDPFVPVIEGGLLYGRGAGDAKASVSAMLYALADLSARGGPVHGRALAIFSFGEETRFATMPIPPSAGGCTAASSPSRARAVSASREAIEAVAPPKTNAPAAPDPVVEGGEIGSAVPDEPPDTMP